MSKFYLGSFSGATMFAYLSRIWKKISLIHKFVAALAALVTGAIALYSEAPSKWLALAKWSKCSIPLTKNYCNPANFVKLGESFFEKGEYERAISEYDEAVGFDPKYIPAYVSRGSARSAKGNFSLANADYNEAIKLNPSYASAYYNRGRMFFAQKLYDRAIVDYSEAIRIDPSSPESLVGRANTYYAKYDYDSAIRDYTEAIR